MILITGDTHGFRDIKKIMDSNIELDSLSKKDYLILLGDVGLLWDSSDKSKELLKFYESKAYNILYIDGNHENYSNLYKCKEVKKFGSYVHKVGRNIYHLKRGHIYNICGKRIYTFGGAYTCNRKDKILGKTWWEEEIPSSKEIALGKKILRDNNNKVHYILTHDCSSQIRRLINKYGPYDMNTPDKEFQSFLNYINNNITFKKWYFGHYHLDIDIDSKHTVKYNTISELR